MLNASELRRAYQLNRYYAYTVSPAGCPTLYPGWAHRLGQISIVLGISSPAEITGEAFAQHVADWQAANGIIPSDGILGERTWAAIDQKTRGLPAGSMAIPAWLSPSESDASAQPQRAMSKTVIPARGWLFVLFHQLPEVGERNLIRKVAVIPNDLILRPQNPNGTITPAMHAGSIDPKNSQFLSTSNRPYASVSGGRGDPGLLIDTRKVIKAGGRIVSQSELIADLRLHALKIPSEKHGVESLIELIKDLEGETLVEGTTPRGSVRPLSPEHTKYLGAAEKLSGLSDAPERLNDLEKSYKNARLVGRVGRVVSVIGFVATAYDVGVAAHQSVKTSSIRPIAAESIRQVGGWAGAVKGIEFGFAAGAALGIETGPGAIITGGIGALVCGFIGYTAADVLADYIYEN